MQNRTLRHFLAFSFVALWLLPSIASAAQISISRIDNTFLGQRKTITISADSVFSDISGFNITIAHQGRKATVGNINPGNLFDSCGWEYFSYRQVSADTVFTFFPEYPVNLINIIGLASLSGNPPSSCNLSTVTLAKIDVKLTYQIQGDDIEDVIWYRFFWRDCNDNVLTSVSGDSLFIANKLYENHTPSDTLHEVNLSYPGFGFPDQQCSSPDDKEVLKNIDFINSGIFWACCVDSISAPIGDINLNGIRFELADAIMLIEYFERGLTVFLYPQAQIPQTDINGDGTVLTIADLVLFIRICIGDYWYYEKPAIAVFETKLKSDKSSHSQAVSIQSNSEISAIYLRFFPVDGQQLSPQDFRFDHPNAMSGQIGDTITMLFVDLEDNQVLSSGTHSIFEYSGDAKFNLLGSAVDIYGRETALVISAETVLPESPILHQNYPNPFNPSTTIEFNLPAETDWRLEIYNVTGQKIKSFSGNGAGSQTVFWNGTNNSGQKVSSGVYFYKLMASGVSNSRKMLLLK